MNMHRRMNLFSLYGVFFLSYVIMGCSNCTEKEYACPQHCSIEGDMQEDDNSIFPMISDSLRKIDGSEDIQSVPRMASSSLNSMADWPKYLIYPGFDLSFEKDYYAYPFSLIARNIPKTVHQNEIITIKFEIINKSPIPQALNHRLMYLAHPSFSLALGKNHVNSSGAYDVKRFHKLGSGFSAIVTIDAGDSITEEESFQFINPPGKYKAIWYCSEMEFESEIFEITIIESESSQAKKNDRMLR